jgi:hypothetical protein
MELVSGLSVLDGFLYLHTNSTADPACYHRDSYSHTSLLVCIIGVVAIGVDHLVQLCWDLALI